MSLGEALREKGRRQKAEGRKPLLRLLFSAFSLLPSALCLLPSAFFLVSCQRVGPGFQKMGRQPRYDPLEPSDFFSDGMASRPRVAGTVARGELVNNPSLETGKIN